jgi:hypothetical protein
MKETVRVILPIKVLHFHFLHPGIQSAPIAHMPGEFSPKGFGMILYSGVDQLVDQKIIY